MTAIAVCNKSTLVSDADVKTMTRAVATQVRHDIAPAWGRFPIPVVYVSSEKDAAPGMWVLFILDDPDQQNALGYHDETSGDVIYGRVFARPVLDNGGDALHKELSVSSVLSHEVAEVVGDPNCNLWADTGAGNVVAVELADPVEDWSYLIGRVNVSNFVLPRWFDPHATEGPFDHLGKLTEPFEVSKGGYAIQMKDGKVSEVFGEQYAEWRREAKQSDLARTARRVT